MDDVRRRVLLAEDDEPLARAVSRRLRVAGWEVTAVTLGERAVELAARSDFDAVLLDMRLRDVSGLEVLPRLRKTRKRPAIVVMSGHLDVPTTLAAIRMGADEVLEKPVDPERLIQVLCEVARPAASSAQVHELVGGSAAMGALRTQIATVATYRDVPVLIVGESGTGKELVARALHRLAGNERSRPVSINCAAMPADLFEAELFGHAAGAFSGARGARAGLLESAAEGTVFLDEIGEMPPALQAKLLRVLETRTFRRVGANDSRPLRARILSATNRPLRGREGEALRPDLYFRLAGVTIRTPALRDHLEDLRALAHHFLGSFADRYPSAPRELSPEALTALRSHSWPGNVRELRAVLQSAVVRASGGVLGVRHVVQALHARGVLDSERPAGPRATRPSDRPSGLRRRPESLIPEGLPELERTTILRVVRECDGNLSRAARALKIPRSTLRDRLKKYGER